VAQLKRGLSQQAQPPYDVYVQQGYRGIALQLERGLPQQAQPPHDVFVQKVLQYEVEKGNHSLSE
jgi:hypothetical protein